MLANETGKAKIKRDGTKTIIEIPTKKNYFILLFLPAWLGGWFFGFESAGTQIFSDLSSGITNGFLIFWLSGWTIGGGFAIFSFLWNAFGKETIISTHDKLTIYKNIFSIGLKRDYIKNEIKNMNIDIHEKDNSFFSKSKNWEAWGFTKGIINFEYGMRTINFGINIDEPEAKYLIEIISVS